MGRPAGRGAPLPLSDRLRELEHRVNGLDQAVCELHPDHSPAILARMHELEATCRAHANKVFTVLSNHGRAVEASARQSTAAADAAATRLQDASARHQEDASALRTEIGCLKDLVDTRSLEAEANLVRMEELVKESLGTLARLDELRTHVDCQLAEHRRIGQDVLGSLHAARQAQAASPLLPGPLPQSRRSRGISVPVLIAHAQRLAESRSPSSRAEACRLKAQQLLPRQAPRTPRSPTAHDHTTGLIRPPPGLLSAQSPEPAGACDGSLQAAPHTPVVHAGTHRAM